VKEFIKVPLTCIDDKRVNGFVQFGKEVPINNILNKLNEKGAARRRALCFLINSLQDLFFNSIQTLQTFKNCFLDFQQALMLRR
jgi:hypothetical protein